MQIHRSVFYRAQHVTGPAAVLVSLRFGRAPEGGPLVIRILAPRTVDPSPKFDVDNHIAEVLAGVAQANSEFNGSLEVEAVEIVPDDYPKKFQAQHVAYKIACAVLNDQV
jgi:hypothetical protein